MNSQKYKARPVAVIVCSLSLFFFFSLPTAMAQVASSTIDIPVPYGGELGTLAGGFAFQSRTRDTEKGFKPDGNVGMSLGLGNSKKAVGLLLTANIYGLSNDIGADSNFGSGALDVQVNRMINDYIFIGAGVRGAAKWKSPGFIARNNRSIFLTSNYIIPIHRRYDEPFSLLFVTAGIGNGLFRLDRDFDPATSGNFNVFGSVALQVLRGTNVILEWNGYDLNTGLSIYPFRSLPALGATLSLVDLTEQRARFVFSAGYSFNLFR